jgi:hypothetical protein
MPCKTIVSYSTTNTHMARDKWCTVNLTVAKSVESNIRTTAFRSSSLLGFITNLRGFVSPLEPILPSTKRKQGSENDELISIQSVRNTAIME